MADHGKKMKDMRLQSEMKHNKESMHTRREPEVNTRAIPEGAKRSSDSGSIGLNTHRAARSCAVSCNAATIVNQCESRKPYSPPFRIRIIITTTKRGRVQVVWLCSALPRLSEGDHLGQAIIGDHYQ